MIPICTDCCREMTCLRVGAIVRTCPGTVRSVDIYHCPECGSEIAVNGGAHYPDGGEPVYCDLSDGDDEISGEAALARARYASSNRR